MTRIIQLQTKFEISTARTELKAAIVKAKASTVVANADLDWDALKWDLTELTERTSPTSSKVIAIIAPLKKKERYPKIWADILLMLLVWLLEEKFDEGEKWNSSHLVQTIKSARRLIDRFIEEGSAADITKVSPSTIEDYFDECGTSGDSGALSLTIGIIARLVARGVTPQLSGVRAKPASRAFKGPSHIQESTWSEIVALGAAYQRLRSPDSPNAKRTDFDYMRYHTMLASLLICAPSRVSELWRTADDIVVLTKPLEHLESRFSEDETENLDFKLALVWHPVKRGRPIIKPIPGAMQEVAQHCIKTLRKYGEDARAAARWIMNNPGAIPIPNEISDLRACRQTGTITHDQLKRLFGLPKNKQLGNARAWQSNFHRTKASRRQSGDGRANARVNSYCFRTLEEEWWQIFQKKWKNAFAADWPYAINTATYKLSADRALLLLFDGQIDWRIRYKNKLFLDTPSAKTLNNLLGTHEGFDNLFQRLDIRLPSGSYPSIQTHDLRHFLNTMAQRAGIPEPIIAMWSGRRNIAQNAVYDHRTDAERLRAHGYQISDYDEVQVDDLLKRQIGRAFEGTISPPSIEVFSTTEKSVRDLNRKLMISVTQFGFCVGDLKAQPCPHAMNCLGCSRLLVCKGAMKATALIEDRLRKLKGQLELLRSHIEEGGTRIKNDKIVPNLEAQITGAEDMLLALNDPDIEDGTIIARKEKSGAIEASFADRVTLFAKEQLEISASRGGLEHG